MSGTGPSRDQDAARSVSDAVLDPVVFPGTEPAPLAEPAPPAEPAPAAAPAPAAEPGPREAPADAAAPARTEAPTAPPPARVEAHLEPASPDVVLPAQSAELPGAHRGGFTRPPTAPLDVVELHPADADPAEWTPTVSPQTTTRRPETESFASGGYALFFAIVALAASLVVGWVFPIGVVAIVLAAIAIRRRRRRTLAVWALVLAAASLLYSAGWLWYALSLIV